MGRRSINSLSQMEVMMDGILENNESEGSHCEFIHISRCELSSTTKSFLKAEGLSIASARRLRERNRVVKE